MSRNRDFLRACTLTCLLLTCLLLTSLAGAAPAFAQDPAAAPGFRIETITVQGAHRATAHNIVAGETRLREGETYDETALEQAVYRVRRLPFVLFADYELREGSAPGAYELVVTIQTYTGLRLEAEGFGVYDGDAGNGEGDEDDRYDSFATGEILARTFVGGRGMVLTSVRKDERADPVGQVGYTQYGLFGPGSSATVTAGGVFSDPGKDAEGDDLFGGLAVSLPVTPNNTLRLAYAWARSDFESATFQRRATLHSPQLQWVYDTTDDPLFTLRGTQVTGTATYHRGEEEIQGTESATDDSYRLAATARRYLPLTRRQALGFTLTSSYQESPDDQAYSAAAGHFANLWETEVSGWRGGLRLESQLAYFRQETDFGFFRQDEDILALSSGLVFRANWAILRGSLSYQETL